MRIPRLSSLLLAASAAMVPVAALAQPPDPPPLSRYVAVELIDYGMGPGEDEIAESVVRRLANHLPPELESLGFVVQRVEDARMAVKHGTHHYGIRVRTNARRVWMVYSALDYGEHTLVDADHGVEIWGRWTLWSHDHDGARSAVTEGRLGPILSNVTDTGAGRPLIDDEEAMTRVYADTIMGLAEPWLDYLQRTPLEYRPEHVEETRPRNRGDDRLLRESRRRTW